MIKFVKFVCLVSFIFSFLPICQAAGKVMPNESSLAYEFKLKDLKDGEVSLGSYKNKKVVVLVFWTTWCPYCREALKSLQADSKSRDNMGLEILAINVGEPKTKVAKLVENIKFSFQVLLDEDSSVADSYDLLGVPTYVVINKSGQIVSSSNSFPKEKLKELTAK
jgi:peroxiredoxin